MDKVREKLTVYASECYSQELSACSKHPIFQPQKFINYVLSYLASLTPEKVREEVISILTEDLVVLSSTHENPPPGHDCKEECGVNIEDQIAASNPITSPMRSGGEKHKKCMDCWNDYIKNLTDRILSIVNAQFEAKLKKAEKHGYNQGVANRV